ncbi:MAG TPA: acyl-CoA dehydrogenase family protein, partial [Solirubrobacteraceae bacterium]|nr:acyl-CoA dehydrogenase family protein [Solirubrobacteraceae bacterium]
MSVVFDAIGYRDEFRGWLDRNGDDAPRRSVLEPQDDAAVECRRAWQRRLADAGYVGVTWPVEFGGRGGLPAQRVVVERELDERGIAGPFDFVGLDMVGPTLLACAT